MSEKERQRGRFLEQFTAQLAASRLIPEADLEAGRRSASGRQGTLLVARGGGWFHSAVHARSACRGHAPPENRVTDKGFRIVSDVSAVAAL